MALLWVISRSVRLLVLISPQTIIQLVYTEILLPWLLGYFECHYFPYHKGLSVILQTELELVSEQHLTSVMLYIISTFSNPTSYDPTVCWDQLSTHCWSTYIETTYMKPIYECLAWHLSILLPKRNCFSQKKQFLCVLFRRDANIKYYHQLLW